MKEDHYKNMSTSNRNESGASKAKLYWAIGIIAVIVAALLIIWNSGILVRNSAVATVGDQDFHASELAYYYKNVESDLLRQAQSYSAYGIDMGYDTNLSPSQQMYDEEAGTTYADYFLDTALTQLQRVTVLCSEAEAAGYTLSEEGEQAVQENMDALYTYSLQQNTTETAYLHMIYGKFIDKAKFKDYITKAILADEFAAYKAEEFTYPDEELNKYYSENAADLDLYDYRSCYVHFETEEKTDDEGNPVEPSEEEMAAAMDAAGEKANAMVADVQAGTAFNTAAVEYLDETSAESFKDPENAHVTDAMGNTIPANFKDWLTNDSRQNGDVTAIKVENVGYCVVQFLGRDKGEHSYQTADYRNLLVLAETTPSESSDTPSLPSEEQLKAAKKQADELLAQWKKDGNNADAFAALVKENSADESNKEDGGLNKDADRGAVSANIQKWLFAEGRKAGEASIVEHTDSNNNVLGYNIIFAEDFGELRWKHQALTTLRSADYEEWYNGVVEQYPAELKDAAKKVPDLS